jgi:hypothetical protein
MNKKDTFAIIISVNLGILFIYFVGREKMNEVVFQDAFVIFIQVVLNLFLAMGFGAMDSGINKGNQQNELKETDILDDDGETTAQNNGKYSRSKSFLLSALLVLLIGFGLCVLNN